MQDIATDPNDAAITRAIIALSHSLNLQVIAEGVETEEQQTFLREHACQGLQGYLISRPLLAESILPILQAASAIACGSHGHRTLDYAPGR